MNCKKRIDYDTVKRVMALNLSVRKSVEMLNEMGIKISLGAYTKYKNEHLSNSNQIDPIAKVSTSMYGEILPISNANMEISDRAEMLRLEREDDKKIEKLKKQGLGAEYRTIVIKPRKGDKGNYQFIMENKFNEWSQLFHSKLFDTIEKIVLVYLLDYTNLKENGRPCSVNLHTIAKEMGITHEKLTKVLYRFEAYGYIKRKINVDGEVIEYIVETELIKRILEFNGNVEYIAGKIKYKEFHHQNFGTLRVLESKEYSWLCLVDICKALDLDEDDVVNHIKDESISKFILPISDFTYEQFNFIEVNNFSFLYEYYFGQNVIDFRRWVSDEVEPQLNKSCETSESAAKNDDDSTENEEMPF